MQLGKIVIGVDFSDASLSAARWLVHHFAPTAELVLVHAIEVPQPPEFMRALLPPHDELIDTIRETAERRLCQLSHALGVERITTEISVGRPADRIATAAVQHRADLVVVGQHGRHRSFGNLLGSTAEQLVRSAPVPVLLARALPEAEPRTILIPIDASALSEPVLAWGRLLRERFHAEAIALHAVSPFILGRARIVSSIMKAESLERDVLRNAERWLTTRLEEASFTPGIARTHVVIGDPAFEINAAVQRFAADLIVMGSRGAGAAGRMLLGSVASSVLRAANCAVLVVHDADG